MPKEHIEAPDISLNFDEILAQPDDPTFKAWDEPGEKGKELRVETPSEDEDFKLYDEGEEPQETPETPETSTEQVKPSSDIEELKLQLKYERAEHLAAQEQLKELVKWKKEVDDYAHNQLLSSLKAERIQALKDHDIDKALELEDRIKQVEEAVQQKQTTTEQPKKDPLVEQVELFVQQNESVINQKIKKIHELNIPDFSKLSEGRKHTMLVAFQQAITEGVKNGKTVDEIVSDYSDRTGLKTVKPVSRTTANTAQAQNSSKGSINDRFNALPIEARKLWKQGGFDRVYKQDLKAYVEDTEKSLRSK